jgi:curved DNA-binding protein CbpA
VLGVMPGAETRKIQRKYEDKASLLRPELISGAPPNVVTAVRLAQELLDTAWDVLGDPDSRKRYDEASGVRAEAWHSRDRHRIGGAGASRPGHHRRADRLAEAAAPAQQARCRPGRPRAVLPGLPRGSELA